MSGTTARPGYKPQSGVGQALIRRCRSSTQALVESAATQSPCIPCTLQSEGRSPCQQAPSKGLDDQPWPCNYELVSHVVRLLPCGWYLKATRIYVMDEKACTYYVSMMNTCECPTLVMKLNCDDCSKCSLDAASLVKMLWNDERTKGKK